MDKDSHEFACKLLEWLHDDTNTSNVQPRMPEIDTTKISESEVQLVYVYLYYRPLPSLLYSLFVMSEI